LTLQPFTYPHAHHRQKSKHRRDASAGFLRRELERLINLTAD
jgi:hypothetical protein